jgi:RNA polymerase primary sigma factor
MVQKNAAQKSGGKAAAKATDGGTATAEAPERDNPILDMSDAAVKKLIKLAKSRGYVTYDEINAVLPSEEVTSEQIEDVMALFSEMGVNVVEQEEGEEPAAAAVDEAPEEEEGSRAVTQQNLPVRSETRAEPVDRTDDPVRMYLREMGTVELLSREGEIAIAKRIEAGREAMIAGLCESPLTFQAIIIWRDELNEAKILLRDIIDLEATYEGPEAKAIPPLVPGQDAPGGIPQGPRPAHLNVAQGYAARSAAINQAAANGEEDVPPPDGEQDDEDEYENALSLAAMEAELKPKVRQGVFVFVLVVLLAIGWRRWKPN